MAGAEGHFVDATLGGAAGFSKTGPHACEVLHFQRDMLQNVGGPGAFL